mgnify:CR=1 FL=1
MPDYRKIDNPAFTILCSGRDNAATFFRNAFAPQAEQDDVPSDQVLLQYPRTFSELPPRLRCQRLENPDASKCWPRSVFFNIIMNLILLLIYFINYVILSCSFRQHKGGLGNTGAVG